MSDEPAGGPWTSHGHDIPGVTVAGPGRPPRMRCGGTSHCRACRAEARAVTAARLRYIRLADAVLALPAVRDALAAQETVTAIRELHACDATEPHACDYCGQAWPCDVIHALDTRGEPE
jgi:hypothetical protein